MAPDRGHPWQRGHKRCLSSLLVLVLLLYQSFLSDFSRSQRTYRSQNIRIHCPESKEKEGDALERRRERSCRRSWGTSLFEFSEPSNDFFSLPVGELFSPSLVLEAPVHWPGLVFPPHRLCQGRSNRTSSSEFEGEGRIETETCSGCSSRLSLA